MPDAIVQETLDPSVLSILGDADEPDRVDIATGTLACGSDLFVYASEIVGDAGVVESHAVDCNSRETFRRPGFGMSFPGLTR